MIVFFFCSFSGRDKFRKLRLHLRHVRPDPFMQPTVNYSLLRFSPFFLILIGTSSLLLLIFAKGFIVSHFWSMYLIKYLSPTGKSMSWRKVSMHVWAERFLG